MALAQSLKCDACNGPRSRYSTSGMCTKCERSLVDAHVAQCRSDIENGISIRHRMTSVLPNLCFNCMKPLAPVECKNGTVKEYLRKFCNRQCQYQYRKSVGIDPSAR